MGLVTRVTRASMLEVLSQDYMRTARAKGVNSPVSGDRKVGDMSQKHFYPMGLVVNANGERFVDEGADFRNYTYAKYGRGESPRQPGRVAYQIFDQKTRAPAPGGVSNPGGDQGGGGIAARSGQEAGDQR